MLYEHVMLPTAAHYAVLERTLLTRKGGFSFLKHRTKLLSLYDAPCHLKRLRNLVSIVSACEHLVDLRIPDLNLTSGATVPRATKIPAPCLAYLSIPLVCLPYLFPSHPAVLTHLALSLVALETYDASRFARGSPFMQALQHLHSVKTIVVHTTISLKNARCTRLFDILVAPPLIEFIAIHFCTPLTGIEGRHLKWTTAFLRVSPPVLQLPNFEDSARPANQIPWMEEREDGRKVHCVFAIWSQRRYRGGYSLPNLDKARIWKVTENTKRMVMGLSKIGASGPPRHRVSQHC